MTSAIEIVWGRSEGRTELSAFDGALARAGIHNYNLVPLSSIVPPEAVIEEQGTHDQQYDVGDTVAVVIAAAETSEPGVVAAGLGWQLGSEGGVFYEASGDSRETCRQQLEVGLADAREIRDWDWDGAPQYRIVEHTVDRAGAAVVAAIFGPLEYTVGK